MKNKLLVLLIASLSYLLNAADIENTGNIEDTKTAWANPEACACKLSEQCPIFDGCPYTQKWAHCIFTAHANTIKQCKEKLKTLKAGESPDELNKTISEYQTKLKILLESNFERTQ